MHVDKSSFLFLAAVITSLTTGCANQNEETVAKPAHEARDQPVTAEDLLILARAGEILSDESKWNRKDNRKCDVEAETWSLFCALHKACIEVVGEYQHRRVAMQEVRFVIEEVSQGIDLGGHRLMGYNNLETTTLEDIKKLLKTASDRVSARMDNPAPAPESAIPSFGVDKVE